MRIKSIAAAAILLTSLGSSAFAGTFGPATASLGSFDVPTVTIDTAHNTGSIKINGGLAQLNGGTGSLSATPYNGSGAGVLNFSLSSGITTADVIAGLFSFSDNRGGSYVFNLASITTISYSNSPNVSSSIALYLLGTMSENNSNAAYQKDATATSLTMTFNSTGTSNFSESGSLSNPPTAVYVATVPEPATMALLGLGLAATGLVRRRNTAA